MKNKDNLKLMIDSFERIETENYIEFRTTNIVAINDTIYDTANRQYILAIKLSLCEKTIHTMHIYSTVYIFLDDNFNIIKVLEETRGVSPRFVIAPNGSVFVSLCELEDGKMIVVPVEGTTEVTKKFRNIGRTEFNFSGKTYGHFENLFNPTKSDEIVCTQFNKDYVCTAIKKVNLDFKEIMNGMKIYIQDDKLYMYKYIYSGDTSQYIVYTINVQFEIINKWISKPVLGGKYHLVLHSVYDDNYHFVYLTKETNQLNNIVLNENGEIVSETLLYTYDDTYEWYSLRPFYEKVDGEVIFWSNNSHNSYLMGIKDDKVNNVIISNSQNQTICKNNKEIYQSDKKLVIDHIRNAEKLVVIASGLGSLENTATGFIVIK